MLAHDNKLACLACSTTVTVSLNFGSKSWDVSPEDFNLGAIDRQGDQCMGGIFDLDSASNESSGGSGNSGPSWVIGDTFLVRITLGFTNEFCYTCSLTCKNVHIFYAIPQCNMVSYLRTLGWDGVEERVLCLPVQPAFRWLRAAFAGGGRLLHRYGALLFLRCVFYFFGAVTYEFFSTSPSYIILYLELWLNFGFWFWFGLCWHDYWLVEYRSAIWHCNSKDHEWG